jgi:hypothetical protein
MPCVELLLDEVPERRHALLDEVPNETRGVTNLDALDECDARSECSLMNSQTPLTMLFRRSNQMLAILGMVAHPRLSSVMQP